MLTAVPSATSVLLYRREWLEDLDATHRRMLGFEQFACKQNYVRLMCKYSQFGHTIFTVRLASLSESDAQAGQPFPAAQRLSVGINSQGLTVFEPQSKTARETFTYNGALRASELCDSWPRLCCRRCWSCAQRLTRACLVFG